MTDYDIKQPHIPFSFGKAGRQATVTLPPIADWSGASENIIAKPDNPWITKAEASGFRETADLPATIDWLQRLAANWSSLRLETIGLSAGKREIKMAVASRYGFDPEAARASGKAVILVQAGIHAGEIDGKDAMMMLLRDLAFGRAPDLLESDLLAPNLLEGAIILFIPVLNVDGFSRFASHHRINQRGPLQVGWHTNDRNHNINRDFGKLDAPETRAVINIINRWRPDLYIDTHVTDGADYQYDITFGHTGGPHAWSPAIAAFVEAHLIPPAQSALTGAGHVPGPLTLTANDRDMRAGRLAFTANARFSTGGADLHHVPSILVENHSLKTFRQRVPGTYILLQSLIKNTSLKVQDIREAIAKDSMLRPCPVPLGWTVDAAKAVNEAAFMGIRSKLEYSAISGEEIPVWTAEPDPSPVAVVMMNCPAATARRPKAYYIPPHMDDIIARLGHHGINMEKLDTDTEITLTHLRLPEAGIIGGASEIGIVGASSTEVLEGHVRVTPGAMVAEQKTTLLRRGTWVVPTDQPLGDLAIVLLEPASPDSFFQWGFILSIFENAAYSEAYVTDPLAADMVAADPEIAAEFAKKLATDETFAASPAARRDWFLSQTPYADPNYRVYPIGREEF